MKGLYVNSKPQERDEQIFEELKKEHDMRSHKWLWTAEKVLSEHGDFDFMITNMPQNRVSIERMAEKARFPKDEYYRWLYSTSFARLSGVHENWPELLVIVYTGADRPACMLAMEEHNVSHLILRGRYELDFEIRQIRGLLAAKDPNPAQASGPPKKIAFIDSCAVEKGWKPGTYGRARHSSDRELIEALEQMQHSVHAYDDLWSAARKIADGDDEKHGPFDFIITNLPHDPPPHPKKPSARDSYRQGGDLVERLEAYREAMDEYWRKNYGRSMAALGFLSQHFPDARIIIYSGAPREICDKCESEYGVYHITLRDRPLRGFPMCPNLKGKEIEKKDILEVVRGK